MKQGILITLLLFSQPFVAKADDQLNTDISKINSCNAHIPPIDETEALAIELQPIVVSAQRAHARQNDTASFSGGVTVEQGDRFLGAQNVQVNSSDSTLTASGGITYKDKMLSVTAESLSSDITSYDTELKDAQYQLHGFNGRGEAESLSIKDQKDLLLTQTSYTACPPGDNSWKVSAEKIDIDSSGEWAQAYDAVIELYDIPIFYTPYFTYPISNKRKSGFLFPSIRSSSNNGIDIKAPIYWNIASDYDATITPRIMANRGVQLQTEFRYLAEDSEGLINAEYLPEDRKLNEHRWMVHWKHDASYARHWRFNTDYTQVGEANYFNDLGSNIQSETDNQLLQSGLVQYLDRYWELSMELRNFQVLGGGDDPYTMLPHFSYLVNYPLGFQDLYFTLNSELTQFDNSNSELTTAKRIHVEPGLVLPWIKPQGFITAEVKLLQTNYIQDVAAADQDEFAKKVNRSLPEFKLHGGLNFDRFTSIFGQQYHNSLEPQLQYLYIPYEDQSEIGIYDTSSLQSDYYGLFRDRRFSGVDRIADANQITFGLTSRYFNRDNQERFRLAVGQNYFVETSRVSLLKDDLLNSSNRSSLIVEMEVNYDEQWYFHASSEVDTQERDMSKGNTAVEFRPEPGKLVQLNYRYIREGGETPGIEQMGSKFSWSLSQDYQLVASYYRDLIEDRSIENFIGIQYDSCCWAVRVAYERKLETNYDSGIEQEAHSNFDSGFKLQFELKGFSNVNSIKDSKMLDGARFDYGRPFYLND